jgi:hypothetical protein
MYADSPLAALQAQKQASTGVSGATEGQQHHETPQSAMKQEAAPCHGAGLPLLAGLEQPRAAVDCAAGE